MQCLVCRPSPPGQFHARFCFLLSAMLHIAPGLMATASYSFHEKGRGGRWKAGLTLHQRALSSLSSSFLLPFSLGFSILNFFLSGLAVGSGDGTADSSLANPLPCPCLQTARGTACGTPLLGEESVPELCCPVPSPLAGGQVWFPPGGSRMPVGKAATLGARTDALSSLCSRQDPQISSSNTQRVTLQGPSPFPSTPHCKKSSPHLLSTLPSSLLLTWHGRRGSRDKPETLQEPNEIPPALTLSASGPAAPHRPHLCWQ